MLDNSFHVWDKAVAYTDLNTWLSTASPEDAAEFKKALRAVEPGVGFQSYEQTLTGKLWLQKRRQ